MHGACTQPARPAAFAGTRAALTVHPSRYPSTTFLLLPRVAASPGRPGHTYYYCTKTVAAVAAACRGPAGGSPQPRGVAQLHKYLASLFCYRIYFLCTRSIFEKKVILDSSLQSLTLIFYIFIKIFITK